MRYGAYSTPYRAIYLFVHAHRLIAANTLLFSVRDSALNGAIYLFVHAHWLIAANTLLFSPVVVRDSALNTLKGIASEGYNYTKN